MRERLWKKRVCKKSLLWKKRRIKRMPPNPLIKNERTNQRFKMIQLKKRLKLKSKK